ncbi:MAG: TetR/AcrR family transcriptional regulator [Solirubrobacterales bacterium]
MANQSGDPERRRIPEEERTALLSAVLALSSSGGYRRLTPDGIAAAAGVPCERFSEFFLDPEDCYATAYEEWAEAFWQRLLEACETEESWPARLRASIQWLVRYATEEPGEARGAIAQAPSAGLRVQAARRSLLERLSHAIDDARRETDLSRHAPPPVTAPFIVGGLVWSVEYTLRNSVDKFRERAGDLVFFAVMPYYGEQVAWAEREALEEGL